LTFATNRAGAWEVEDIQLGFEYLTSGIAVDSQDKVHMLCSASERVSWGPSWDEETSYVAHLLHYTEGVDGWERSDVYAPVENATTIIQSFEIGRGDVMHALVSNSVHPFSIFDDEGQTYLNYSSTRTGTWTQETIPEGRPVGADFYLWATGWKSMAIDGDNGAHICGYSWSNTTSSYVINYKNNVNGEWVSVDLSYAGNAWPTTSSITLDSQGAVHIAYFAKYFDATSGYNNQTERYVTNRGGLWNQEVVDDKSGWLSTQRICVAVGFDDEVYIAYFCNLGDEDSGDRYYVRYATPTDKVDALVESALEASLYAFGAALVVCVGFLVYRRRNKRRLRPEIQAERTTKRYRDLFPPDE